MIPIETVRCVKRLLSDGVPQRRIAAECGVARGTVARVKSGKTTGSRPPYAENLTAELRRTSRVRLLLRGLGILICKGQVESLQIRLRGRERKLYQELHDEKVSREGAIFIGPLDADEDVGEGPSEETLGRMEAHG